MQKVKLVDLRKLNKTSALVQKEAAQLLQQAYEAIEAQESFFRDAGVEPEDLNKLLNSYQMSDEVKQKLDLWETALHAELAQAKAQKKKEMKLADKLLVAKTRSTGRGNKKRCTRIF